MFLPTIGRIARGAALIVLLASGCADSQAPSRPVQHATKVVVLPAASSLGDRWKQVAEITYGPSKHQAGRADPHGGQATAWGPEFVAPAPDRTWWLLDIHKRRIVRFTEEGALIRAVPIPGRDAGLQRPFVLDGRWLVATGGLSQQDLVADADRARRVDFPFSTIRLKETGGSEVAVPANWFYSDGHALFSDDGTTIRALTIRQGEPVVRRAESFRTPGGKRFIVRISRDRLRVRLLSARKSIDVRFTGPRGNEIRSIFEVAADEGNNLHFLIYGDDDGTQLAGYMTIDQTANVSSIESVRDPFSPSTPGSAAHLRVIPGTSTATLCFVDTDAVRIYERSE